ncbi:MAG: hypothetical protein IK096_01435 [Lachnospiraceae bacterium]|nr:hypothetical protein [Lachnospiraceae bacterium]
MNLMQQITQDLRLAEICAGAALLFGLAAIVLFFTLRIPACLRALTGIGRRRAIRKLGAEGASKKPADRPSAVVPVRRELPEQFIMETDIGIYERSGRIP